MNRSNKIYGRSPSVARGDDGLIAVIRPSNMDAMGLSGVTNMGDESQMPVSQRQHHERRDMYDRHTNDMRTLQSRHQREYDQAEHDGADTGMLMDKHVGEHADMHMRQLQEIKDMLARHIATDKD